MYAVSSRLSRLTQERSYALRAAIPARINHRKPPAMQASHAHAAALILRLALGAMFVAHALLKYYVFTLPGTAQFFGSLGLPAALAYVTFFAELAGVYTRAVALALVPILLGATWVHAGNGWLFSAPNGGWEYPAFWTVALIVQALLGDGAFALKRAERVPSIGTANA